MNVYAQLAALATKHAHGVKAEDLKSIEFKGIVGPGSDPTGSIEFMEALEQSGVDPDGINRFFELITTADDIGISRLAQPIGLTKRNLFEEKKKPLDGGEAFFLASYFKWVWDLDASPDEKVPVKPPEEPEEVAVDTTAASPTSPADPKEGKSGVTFSRPSGAKGGSSSSNGGSGKAAASPKAAEKKPDPKVVAQQEDDILRAKHLRALRITCPDITEEAITEESWGPVRERILRATRKVRSKDQATCVIGYRELTGIERDLKDSNVGSEPEVVRMAGIDLVAAIEADLDIAHRRWGNVYTQAFCVLIGLPVPPG